MDTFHKVPPYGLVRDWLGVEAVERLLSYAESRESLFEESKLSSGLDRTRRISKRIDLGDHKTEVRAKFEQLLPKVFETLSVKPFAPIFELELVAHGHGAFFARHFDSLIHRNRIISAVYYFHVLPKAFSGGVLRLHSLAASGEEGTFVDISPGYDTLVFFPSMFSHEVLPVKSPSGEFLHSRFAINCWIRRAGDAAPTHTN
jgi:SM-20-related protein